MPPATSPSSRSRVPAPAARMSSMSCSCRGRSSTATDMSSTSLPLAFASARMFSPIGRARSTTPDALGAGRRSCPCRRRRDGSYIVPRSATAIIESGVLAAGRGERGAVDRVDGDVAGRRRAVADVLAVEEHRRVVLLALADDDDAVEVDGAEELAHRVDRGAVGGVLVAAADERNGADRRGLGRTHELHAEVAVGVEEEGAGFGSRHASDPY